MNSKNSRVMLMRSIFAVWATVGAAIGVQAQMTVDTTLTPEQLAQDVLAGNCVSITNVTYNGQPSNVGASLLGIGSFSALGIAPGLSAGVILATGDLALAGQAQGTLFSSILGTGSDQDLETLSGQDIMDKSILEFDFVPTGDSISFRFVFASEEYENFECTVYNDAFGFFLSGPGISGPFSGGAINLANVPGGAVPITINTINSGVADGDASLCAAADPNWESNTQFYSDNSNGSDVVYFGMTVVLTARALVQCNQTYHIKLAIGDGVDDGLDSAVFLEAGSFNSDPFVPELTPSAGVVGTTMLESCLPLSMGFVRTACDLSTVQVVQLNYTGTGTMGVDVAPAFPDSLVFGSGVEVITVDFTVPQDADGDEVLEITTTTLDCNGDPTSTSFDFTISSPAPLQVESINSQVGCNTPLTLSPAVTGGFGQYVYSWSNGTSGNVVDLVPTQPVVLELTVSDICGLQASAVQQVGLTPAPNITMLIFGNNEPREGCDDATVNVIRPVGSVGQLSIDLSSSGSATSGSDYVLPPQLVIPDGALNGLQVVDVLDDAFDEGTETVILTGSYTNACAQTVTATTEFTIQDIAPMEVLVNDIEADCSNDTALVQATVDGGAAPYTYLWNTEDETPDVWVALQDDAELRVTVTDACGRVVLSGSSVVINCELIIPNVFTPNEDGKNDRWEIRGLGNKPNELRIFNRWGGLVFDVKNYRNTFTANSVSAGTYFYEITVQGKPEPYTGHITILKD